MSGDATPWQWERKGSVPDAVKERPLLSPLAFDSNAKAKRVAYEVYSKTRKYINKIRKGMLQKGTRSFSAKIIRVRNGKFVNVGTGSYRKEDYELEG